MNLNVYKGKKKAGPKPGSKYAATKTNNDWAVACKTFLEGPKLTQKAFLQSDASGPKFSGSPSEIVNFSRKLKAYNAGELKVEAADFKQKSKGQFPEIERALVHYINVRAQKFNRDKLGLSFNFLKDKANEFALALGKQDGFKASTGWVEKVFKRNGLTRKALIGAQSSQKKRDTNLHDFFQTKKSKGN